MPNPTFPQMVSALAKPGEAILTNLTPNRAHILHMLIGLSGEVGELGDGIKKGIIYNKPLDFANLIEELGDVEFYLEGLRQGLGITREESLAHCQKKLAKRYGEKYSDSAAQLRADKA